MGTEVFYDSKELFGKYTDPDYFPGESIEFDALWNWPEELGTGYYGAIIIKPGLLLRIGSYKIVENLSIGFDLYENHINFEFGLSGAMETTASCVVDEDVFSLNSDYYSIAYHPGWRARSCISSTSPVQSVGLLVTPDTLLALLGQGSSLIPEKISEMISNVETRTSFYHNSKISNGLYSIVREILYCPYQGNIRKIYLEAKGLELFSMVMESISSESRTIRMTSSVKYCDIEKMHKIRRILEENMETPPSLKELSMEAGVSHPKLNSCFKKVYGKTVFEYFREIRLKKAKLLLESGNMNVTEAAYEIGYSNLSYFTKSFKKEFGFNPGDYLKKISS